MINVFCAAAVTLIMEFLPKDGPQVCDCWFAGSEGFCVDKILVACVRCSIVAAARVSRPKSAKRHSLRQLRSARNALMWVTCQKRSLEL